MTAVSAPSLPVWLFATLLALTGLCASGISYALAGGADARLLAVSTRYVQALDTAQRRMLMPARGRTILSLQVIVCALLLLMAAGLRWPLLAALLPIALCAPAWTLARLRKRRRAAIEAKLDSFALALANATRATPSIGRALQLLQSTLSAPLDAEIEQVLREMRVGSSVEQALINLSWRVQSDPLDALLSGVLVARRVGGKLPETLETTASTLREMARLDGVLRAKTAQARMQIWVLGCLPPFLVFAFERVNTDYFRPLTENMTGYVLIALAIAGWIGALLMARKILAVEL
jgi:tight adherence protein B